MNKAVEKKLAHLSSTQKQILILDVMVRMAVKMYIAETQSLQEVNVSMSDGMELLGVNVLVHLQKLRKEQIDSIVSSNEAQAERFVEAVLNSPSPEEYILLHPELNIDPNYL